MNHISDALTHRNLRLYLWEPICFGLMAAGFYAVVALPFVSTDAQQQAIPQLHVFARNLAMGLALWRIALSPAILKLLAATKDALQDDDDDERR